MGEIKVCGYAEKYVVADVVKYSITFETKKKVLKDAIETVTSECNEFLKCLNEIGIEYKDIHLIDGGDNYSSYNNNELKSINRKIEFNTGFDARINNYVLNTIKDKGMNARVSLEYLISNEKEIRKELIKLATINAKQKAEEIAKTLDMKVISIISIMDNNYEDDYKYLDNDFMHPVCGLVLNDDSCSGKLSAKQIHLKQKINGLFNIEKELAKN